MRNQNQVIYWFSFGVGKKVQPFSSEMQFKGPREKKTFVSKRKKVQRRKYPKK